MFKQSVLYKTNVNEHMNWYKGYHLLETCHLFNPDKKSNYRLYIRSVVKNILLYKRYKKGNIDLYNNSCNDWVLYELYAPFKNINRLHIIDNLKIYVNYNADELDAYSISDDLQYDVPLYNQSELPLYKLIGIHINVLTIVISLPEEYTKYNEKNENKLIGIISHELQYALDLIGTTKILQDANNGNNIIGDFHNLYLIYENCPIIINNYYVDDYILNLKNIAYYTQKTEINAHIESVLSEMIRTPNSKDIILNYCKNPGGYNEQVDMPTLHNYVQLYRFIKRQLNLYNYELYKNYNYIFDDILDLVKKYKLVKNNGTYKELLEFWVNHLQYFFKRLSDVVYVNIK